MTLESFNATMWNRIPKNKFHGQKRVETALMLCIIDHEDGKAGLLPVMSSLSTFSREAGSVFEQHDTRRRKLKEQAQERRKTVFQLQKNKALERFSGESYFPGILSSAAGPSGDMGSVPRNRFSKIDSFSIDQFVVLPYGLPHKLLMRGWLCVSTNEESSLIRCYINYQISLVIVSVDKQENMFFNVDKNMRF